MTPTPHTDPAIIAQTIGREYERPKLKAPFFADALVDFSSPKYVAEALEMLTPRNNPKNDK